jgi:hypothetical protein
MAIGAFFPRAMQDTPLSQTPKLDKPAAERDVGFLLAVVSTSVVKVSI